MSRAQGHQLTTQPTAHAFGCGENVFTGLRRTESALSRRRGHKRPRSRPSIETWTSADQARAEAVENPKATFRESFEHGVVKSRIPRLGCALVCSSHPIVSGSGCETPRPASDARRRSARVDALPFLKSRGKRRRRRMGVRVDGIGSPAPTVPARRSGPHSRPRRGSCGFFTSSGRELYQYPRGGRSKSARRQDSPNESENPQPLGIVRAAQPTRQKFLTIKLCSMPLSAEA